MAPRKFSNIDNMVKKSGRPTTQEEANQQIAENAARRQKRLGEPIDRGISNPDTVKAMQERGQREAAAAEQAAQANVTDEEIALREKHSEEVSALGELGTTRFAPQPATTQQIVNEDGSVQALPEGTIPLEPIESNQIDRAANIGAPFGAAAAATGILGASAAGAGIAAGGGAALFGSISAAFKSVSSFVVGAGTLGYITNQKVRGLEEDISQLATGSRSIAALGKENPEEAISVLNEIESNIIKKGGELHVAMRRDIVTRINNEGIEEFMFSNLAKVTKYRQALEVYRLNGDEVAFQRELGQEQAQQ